MSAGAPVDLSSVLVDVGAQETKDDGGKGYVYRPMDRDHGEGRKMCAHASGFNCMLATWCAVTFIVPIIVLVMAGDKDGEEETYALQVLAIVCFAVGMIVCCCSMGDLINGGVVGKPEPPARTLPLVNAFNGDKSYHKVRMSKVHIVVNPFSGTKRSLEILKMCQSKLQAANIEAVVHETQRAGHAIEIAQTCEADGFSGLIVIGGDGSFHEAVNGMLTRKDGKSLPIGLVPGGSGNSLLADLGITGHTDAGEVEAIERIIKGDVNWIDANLVTIDDHNRIFSVNELTWGLTGDVGADAETARCLGPSRYDICAVWGIFRNIARGVKVTVKDSGEVFEGKYTTAFVNQTQHFGKELRACPHARIDDGKLDLVVMRNSNRATLMKVFALLPTGAAHGNIKGVDELQAKHVVFEPAESGVVNIDGENFAYEKKLELQCLPKAVRMFMPPTLCSNPAPAGYAAATVEGSTVPAATSSAAEESKAEAASA